MTPSDTPRIDAHAHYFHDRPFLEPLLREWGMRVVLINVATNPGLRDPAEQRWLAMLEMKQRYPDRVELCTTFDAAGIGRPGFVDRVIRGVEADLRQGARWVKVWKDVGLDIREADGRYVQVDDPRFQPVWDFLAERGVPVVAHIAEPRAAWLPLDPRSPHFRYYSANPGYHFHGRPDVPGWEEILAARDRWVERNPRLTIIGAHLGSMEHDVGLVAARLERFPNLLVDTAERFGDLVTQPSDRVRDLFLRYPDRILYGTDALVELPAAALSSDQRRAEQAAVEAMYRTHRDYLAGRGTITIADKLVEPVTVEALDLPAEVLRMVCHDNAARLLDGDHPASLAGRPGGA